MKKINLAFFLILIVTSTGFSQNWSWATNITGGTSHLSEAIAQDSDGNIYIGGTHKGNAIFGNSDPQIELVGSTANLPYLAKYSPEGTVLWVLGFGDNQASNLKQIHADANNNVYVVGSYKGTESDPFIIRSTDGNNASFVAQGSWDHFLAKFNSDGKLLFAKSYGSPTEDRMFGVSSNQMGNIVISGIWRGGTLNLGNGYSFSAPTGETQSFTAILNESGETEKAIAFVSPWVRADCGINRCLDEGYTTALNFQQHITIPQHGTINASSASYQQVFLKINDNAEVVWYNHIESQELYGAENTACDPEGNSYFAGRFRNSVTFPSYNNDKTISLSAIGNFDGYIAKYDKNGVVVWAKRWGGLGEERSHGLSINNGVVSLAGYAKGTVYLGDENGIQDTLISGGGTEALIINFDANGNYLGYAQTHGAGDNNALVCQVDWVGNTIIAGSYSSNPLQVGEFLLNREGDQNAFLAKHINLRALVTISDITCHSDENGMLTLNGFAGGEEPYTYTFGQVGGDIIDSGIFTETVVYNDLESGIYRLEATDALNRTITRFYHIIAPEPIQINSTLTHVNGCYGNDNGAITLTVTGGTGDYTFFWDIVRGYGIAPTTQNQGSLTAGIYSVTVTDANGCTATETFELTQPERINFGGSTVTNNTSTSSPNGAINLTVNKGAEPYSYNWKKPNGEESNSQNLTGIRGGAYVLYLEDANGCNVDTVFNVLDQGLFNAYIVDIKNPKCKGGADGSVTIDFENITGNITIEWSNGQTDVITATNLSAGEYWVTVTDDMGTPGDDSDDFALTIPVLVGEPLYALDVHATVIKTTCPTDNDGSILLTVNGCSAPYEFNWSTTNGSGIVVDEKDQFNLSVGSYTYNVTDQYGCIVNSSVQVSSTYSAPSFTIDIQPDNNVCQGTEVEISVSPGFNYLFVIDDIPQGGYSPNTTLTITDPMDGMRVKVIGMNTAGCTKESEEITLNVTLNVGIPMFVQGSTQLCEGSTETYTATAENAEFIVYSLVSGSATVNPITGEVTDITENFTIAATAYGFNNCGEEYVELDVIVNPIPTPVISTTDPLEWLENEVINVAISTDIADAEAYQWFHNDDPISGATQSSYLATQEGIYTVEATLLGCTGLSNEIEITLIPVYTIAFNVAGENDEPIENAEITIEGYQPLYTNDIGNATINLPNGDYTFQVSATCYHTFNGTFEVDNSPQMVEVTLNAYPVPVFIAGPEMLCAGATETYTAVAEGNLIMIYTIVNGSATVDSATGLVTNITDDFTIRATASFANGCQKYAEMTVTVNPIPTPTISTTDPLVWTEGDAISVTFVVDITDGEAYQWFRNDEPISGATQSSYQATQEGVYSVEVTKLGCMGVSNTLEITVTPVDTYTVSFYVTNDKGNAVKNAEITIAGYTPIVSDNDGFTYIDLPNGNYTFTVTANDHEGYSNSFEVDGVNITIPVELIYVSIPTEQLIGATPYPNPFGNEIYIENAQLVKRVIISSITGHKIAETTLTDSKLNTSTLKPGIYIITFIGHEGKMAIHKMIKQ